MDYDAWQFWVGVGQAVFNVLIAAYLWFDRRHRATNARVEKIEQVLEGRIEAGEKDILTIQTELKFLPTQKQLRRLSDTMTSLQGDLNKVQGRLEGVNRVADLMNEYLINKEKG